MNRQEAKQYVQDNKNTNYDVPYLPEQYKHFRIEAKDILKEAYLIETEKEFIYFMEPVFASYIQSNTVVMPWNDEDVISVYKKNREHYLNSSAYLRKTQAYRNAVCYKLAKEYRSDERKKVAHPSSGKSIFPILLGVAAVIGISLYLFLEKGSC